MKRLTHAEAFLRSALYLCFLALAGFIAAAVYLSAGCGLFQSIKDNPAKTVRDVAEVACNVFGQEHPDELRRMAAAAAPDAVGDDPEGLAIPFLCLIPSVIDLFVPGAQMAVGQAETAAGLKAPDALCE